MTLDCCKVLSPGSLDSASCLARTKPFLSQSDLPCECGLELLDELLTY